MYGALEHESTYWNEAYKECFGQYPSPLVAQGEDMAHVAVVQSAVMRYWVERMKEAVSGAQKEV